MMNGYIQRHSIYQAVQFFSGLPCMYRDIKVILCINTCYYCY